MTDHKLSTVACRLCGTPLTEPPVYPLKNQPARIQGFTTQETLDQDTGTDLDAYQCAFCGHIQLDVIIVNAPRYHDEIIKQIKEKENFGGQIVTLLNGQIETIR